MTYYYAEIKDGKVVSWGDATNMEVALKGTTGTVLELTQREYRMLDACRGDFQLGVGVLQKLEVKISEVEEL